jgi:hypothetical protein
VIKECPHCHAKSLGWRELITLNSFSPVQCENCQEWVLASGWRQLLGVLTFIAIFVATMPLWRYIPGETSVLLVPFAVILFAMAMMVTARPVKPQAQLTDPSPFTPDPNNDKTILIQGWSKDELRQILDDFVEEDLTAFAAFRIEIETRLDNCLVLTFPEDIHPAEFVSLINHLAYPIDLNPAGRAVVVAGQTTLNSDFDGLPQALSGKKALFYLPDDDKDHDVVFLKTESGVTLARFFSDGIWRSVTDSGPSSAIQLLASGEEPYHDPIAAIPD